MTPVSYTHLDVYKRQHYFKQYSLWQTVCVVTIQNCFANCGFSISQASFLLPEATIKNEDASCLLQVKNQEEFIWIDENIQFFNENKESNDTILEKIAISLNAVDKNDDDEDEPDIHRVTTQDAKTWTPAIFYARSQ